MPKKTPDSFDLSYKNFNTMQQAKDGSNAGDGKDHNKTADFDDAEENLPKLPHLCTLPDPMAFPMAFPNPKTQRWEEALAGLTFDDLRRRLDLAHTNKECTYVKNCIVNAMANYKPSKS